MKVSLKTYNEYNILFFYESFIRGKTLNINFKPPVGSNVLSAGIGFNLSNMATKMRGFNLNNFTTTLNTKLSSTFYCNQNNTTEIAGEVYFKKMNERSKGLSID